MTYILYSMVLAFGILFANNIDAAITITNPGTGNGTIKLFSIAPPNGILLESCSVGPAPATCQVGVSQDTLNGNVIQAVAASNSFFVGWGGAAGSVGACNNTNQMCNITGTSSGGGNGVNATFTACTVTINPNNKSFDWSGGVGNIDVATNNNVCNWTVRSNVSWITISSASNGTGNGTVSYTVSPNRTNLERNGTIEIGGNVFNVKQGEYLPSILITPETIDFGTVKTGQLSERHATVRNLSASNILQINQVQIYGQESEDYRVNHNCSTLNPFGSCTIKIGFLPTSTTNKTATLSVKSNDTHHPNYEVTVTGRGNASASANISVNPNSFNFSPIDVEFGHVRSVNITNSGTGSLLIHDVRFAGRSASEFHVVNSCPIILAGESCSLTFYGYYTSNSPKEASLVIHSNADNMSIVEIPITASSPNCLNGNIILADSSKTINQEASSYATSVTRTGETGCLWLATNSASWLSTNLSNTELTYTAQANNSNQLRMANVKVGGEVLTVIQHKDANNRTFDDIAGNYFENYINAIYTHRITIGCIQDVSYCPQGFVTRGEMAAFIIRALQGENFNYNFTPYFTDVPSNHTFFKYVQKMRDLRITVVTGEYRINDRVTRGEMAAFIIRAIFGEDFSFTQTPYFSDVPSNHTFFKYVQKMRDMGITVVTGIYRVDDYVTRQEMSAFLARAFLNMR